MRENEFEKNVQQRMDEFRLRPSDAVWGKVAGELHRKKKRRTVFFIFLLAGFGLMGYSGFYFLNHSKQNIVEENSTLATKPTSTPVQERLASPVKEVSGETPKDQTIRDQQNGNLPAKNNNADNILSKEPSPAATGIQTNPDQTAAAKTGAKQQNSAPAISQNAVVRKQPAKHLPKQSAPKEITDELPMVKSHRDQPQDRNIQAGKEGEQAAVTDNKKEAGDPVNVAAVQKKEDSIVVGLADLKIPDSSEIALENKTVAAKKSLKIKWGIDFSVGISDSRKTALPFSDGQKALDVYNNAPQSNFPGSAGYFPIQPPSPVDPGLGFKIGPVGQLQLSKRSRISFGLQYAFMSSRMKTGTYTATSVVVNNSISQSLRLNAVYQGLYREDFTNRFHFIQAPVKYHLQLNNGKKLPIDWNVGASAGYLVATNGLLYDSIAGGIYYHDKEAYNRFQFNVHTGFSFRFNNNRNIQWAVGPELTMAMNKLVADPYSKKQYLMYGGVTGRLIFSKKNK